MLLQRTRRFTVLSTTAAAPGLAAAHGGALDWHAAASDSLLVLVPLLAGGSLYAIGLLRRAAHGLTPADGSRASAFFAALLVLGVALVWPLDAWAELSFAAHMGQHMLLVAIAPPLLLLGRPAALWLRALPHGLRAAGVSPRRWPGTAVVRRFCGSIAAMAALHGALLWGWHLPAAFDLALRHERVHWVEHVTLLASGVLFWRVLLRSRGANAGWAVAAMLVTVVHTGLLGALLSLSPRVLYGAYAGNADALGDQQLAGLIMWVPMGVVYVAAALAFAARALGGAADPGGEAPSGLTATGETVRLP